ncbi:MAG: hypothetical protein M3X11_14885 [Acidobacteriota bacterium]|nr:hypothetical protein [Acidobacteriota bacterium]
MSSSIQVAEEIEPKAEDLPIDRPRKSGVVIRPGNREGAMALLDAMLAEGDPEEERETLEFLKQAINEHRAAVGARLPFEDSIGLIVRRVDPQSAKTLLSELDDFDEADQRETLEYLKQALNKTRAAQGARLIFPDEQIDLA